MNRIYLIVFIGLSVFTNAFGHNKLLDSLGHVVRIAIPDTSNSTFFATNTGVKYISAEYLNNQPSLIFLIFDQDSDGNEKREIYDLTFCGDAYVLTDKYGSIQFMDPKASIEPIPNRNEVNAALSITGASIYRDTVFFSFSHRDDIKSDASTWAVGSQARYKGDISSLGAKIVQRLQKKGGAVVVDSTLVFQGTLTRYGYLKDLILVFGEKSIFSDLAAEVLLGEANEAGTNPLRADWHPAAIDRGTIDVKFRICVKLEPDGTVTVATPQKLRSFTGL